MYCVHLPSLRSSDHPDPFHLTINPTAGAGGKELDIAGFDAGGPPPAATCAAGTVVVWLPDSKTKPNPGAPLAARANARGCLPRTGITWGLAEGVFGS